MAEWTKPKLTIQTVQCRSVFATYERRSPSLEWILTHTQSRLSEEAFLVRKDLPVKDGNRRFNWANSKLLDNSYFNTTKPPRHFEANFICHSES
jgi:hypothetical protein